MALREAFVLILTLFALNAFGEDATVKVLVKTAQGNLSGVEGRGILTQVDLAHGRSRQYVFTAAHVSKGREVELSLRGRRLTILGRLADHLNDVEIFEVQKMDINEALVKWNKQFSGFIGVFNERNGVMESLRSDYRFKPFKMGNQTDDAKDINGHKSFPPFVAENLNEVKTAAEAFTDRKFSPAAKTFVQNILGDFVFRSNIAPGMSGSPLFTSAVYYNPQLTIVSKLSGLVTQYSYKLNQSFVVGEKYILDVYERYLKGDRGDLLYKLGSKVYSCIWIDEEKGSYRRFVDKKTGKIIFQERVILKNQASGGTNGDGSGGTNGDGSGEGNGESSLHGIDYEGKQIQLMEIRLSSGLKVIVQANWTAIRYLIQNQLLKKTSLMSQNLDRYGLLSRRFENLEKKYFHSLEAGTRILKTSSGFSVDIFRYNYQGSYDKFKFEISKDKLQLGSLSYSMNNKYISFADLSGNNAYILDVEDLFAVNIENVPVGRKKSKDPLADAYRQFVVQIDPRK